MKEDKKLVTIKEASEITGLHTNTIRKYIKKGALIVTGVRGKFRDEIRIYKNSLNALMLKQEEQMSMPVVTAEEAISYKELYQKYEKKYDEIQELLRNRESFIGSLQAQLENERKLLTDRALSLIEKEAKTRELEAKLNEEEAKSKETLTKELALQEEIQKKEAALREKDAEISELKEGNEKSQKETHILKQETESRYREAQEEAEKLRRSLQQEAEIRNKLEAELIEASKPWWKKMFGLK